MIARQPAAEGLGFIRLHGHDPHIVGPGLDGLAHARDGARTAHPDGDGVHDAGTLPRNGFDDGRACHPAVERRIVVVGQPVHIVPAFFGGGLPGQRPGGRKPAPGRDMEDFGSQPQQLLLPQGRGVLRHGQHHRVARRLPGQCQCQRKGSGRSLDDRLAGLEGPALVRQSQHPLGQVVPCRAGGAVVVQIGIQPPPQPAGGQIAPQLHNGAGQQGLVEILVDGHGEHSFPQWATYNLIVTQSGWGVKPRFGKNGEFLPKNLANCPINPLTGFAGSGILRM